jgi:hypothetical protein
MYKSTIEPEYLKNFCEWRPWPFDGVEAWGTRWMALSRSSSPNEWIGVALALSSLELG